MTTDWQRRFARTNATYHATVTRAQAVLALGADWIDRAVAKPMPEDADKLALRREFERALEIVGRVANRETVYDGDTRLSNLVLDDPRTAAISRLAEFAGIDEADLDAWVAEAATTEDGQLAEVLAFMDHLRRPRKTRRHVAWRPAAADGLSLDELTAPSQPPPDV